jgi:hypothetical protein
MPNLPEVNARFVAHASYHTPYILEMALSSKVLWGYHPVIPGESCD